MAEDIERLREVAEAATPGPWEPNVLGSEGYEVRGPDVPHKPTSNVMRRPRVARCGYEEWDVDKANAEHIAAFDPPTVLALLDRLARVEALAEEIIGDGVNDFEHMSFTYGVRAGAIEAAHRFRHAARALAGEPEGSR